MHETHKHNTEQKKAKHREYKLYNSFYVKFKNSQNFGEF